MNTFVMILGVNIIISTSIIWFGEEVNKLFVEVFKKKKIILIMAALLCMRNALYAMPQTDDGTVNAKSA